MNANILRKITTLLALAVAPGLALAAEATLKVGDTAPKLQTGKWVQGEPVKDFAKGKAYIVEFWATWCGPCRASIPHLNEIYTRFKDKGLVVIGQNCWERDESLVAPFVEKMGDTMTYRVALDDKTTDSKGAMATTWMAAAGRNGIPSAFLVNKKGVIAWIGHPMELKDSVIESVLAGSFDLKKAAADYEQRAHNEDQLRTVWLEFDQARNKKDWDAAGAKLDEAAKLMPSDNHSAVDMARFDLMFSKKDFAAAYKLAAGFSDHYVDNPTLQNEIAWRIVSDKAVENPDLALAEKLATQANAAAKGNNPAVLDTLARVRFLQGKRDQAVSLQQKAIELAEDGRKPALQRTLDSYKGGKLPEVF